MVCGPLRKRSSPSCAAPGDACQGLGRPAPPVRTARSLCRAASRPSSPLTQAGPGFPPGGARFPALDPHPAPRQRPRRGRRSCCGKLASTCADPGGSEGSVAAVRKVWVSGGNRAIQGLIPPACRTLRRRSSGSGPHGGQPRRRAAPPPPDEGEGGGMKRVNAGALTLPIRRSGLA